MPIYEYGCPDCGTQFEEWQKMSDDPVTECPKCGEGNVKKLLSAPAFHLKGGGWYSDHYGLKGDSSSSSESASESSESSESSSSESSSDSGSSDTSSSPASASDE